MITTMTVKIKKSLLLSKQHCLLGPELPMQRVWCALVRRYCNYYSHPTYILQLEGRIHCWYSGWGNIVCHNVVRYDNRGYI